MTPLKPAGVLEGACVGARDRRLHNEMRGLFAGALLIAGALAFLPSRLMWQVVFG